MKLSALLFPLAFANPILDDSAVSSGVPSTHFKRNVGDDIAQAFGFDRFGSIQDAYKQDQLELMAAEFAETKEQDYNVILFKKAMLDKTFLGAMSTYSDVWRFNEDTTNEDFVMFRDLWGKVYHLFYDNNHQGQAKFNEKAAKTADSAAILLLITPSYYSVESGQYEMARKYLAGRLGDKDTGNKLHIKQTTQRLEGKHWDFIQKVVDDTDKRSYITYMLNMYYQYGQMYNAPAGPKQDKRIYGWGAMKKDSDENKNLAVGATAAGWVSLFGLGYSVAAIYTGGAAATDAVLAEEDVVSRLRDQGEQPSLTESTTISATSSTSTSSSSSNICSTLAKQEQKEIDEQEKDDDYAGTVGRRDLIQRDGFEASVPLPTGGVVDLAARDNEFQYPKRALSDYCNGAQNQDRCNEAIKRHTIKLNTDNWQYTDIPMNVDTDSFYRFLQPGSNDPRKVSERLPIYVVNPFGQSQGVACNALKFVAQNYDNSEYFSGFTSADNAHKSTDQGMLTLIRGKRWTRKQAMRSINCKGVSAGWAKKTTGTSYDGSDFQLDEFPPSSANVAIGVDDIVLTCVPDYDNSREAVVLLKFYTRGEPQEDQKKALEKYENCKDSSISRLLDARYYLPNTPNSGTRDKIKSIAATEYDKKMNEDDPKFNDNAFMVVINTKTEDGQDIDCSRYMYGSDFESR